jgi:hypothetical protein
MEGFRFGKFRRGNFVLVNFENDAKTTPGSKRTTRFRIGPVGTGVSASRQGPRRAFTVEENPML